MPQRQREREHHLLVEKLVLGLRARAHDDAWQRQARRAGRPRQRGRVLRSAAQQLLDKRECLLLTLLLG